MKEFLSSVKFKIIIAIVALFCGTMLYFATATGNEIAPSNIIGAIITPIKTVAVDVTNSISNFFSRIVRITEIAEENEMLKEKVTELTQQTVDYYDYKNENEQLRDFFNIKEKYEEYSMQPALIIGKSSEKLNSEFTVNKGTSSGVAVGDPVITAEGLCGVVTKVALTFSRVTTVISGEISVGAFNTVTREAGIVTSDSALYREGMCKLTMLSRDTFTATDDIIITSGTGGVYPRGLVIGTVTEVIPDQTGLTYCAMVKPAVDIENITDVAIITDFVGQGIKLED